jgi:hypothetical protein
MMTIAKNAHLVVHQVPAVDERVDFNLGRRPDCTIRTKPFHVGNIDNFLADGRVMAVAVVGSVAAITKYYHVGDWTVRSETLLAHCQFRIPTSPVALTFGARGGRGYDGYEGGGFCDCTARAGGCCQRSVLCIVHQVIVTVGADFVDLDAFGQRLPAASTTSTSWTTSSSSTTTSTCGWCCLCSS